MLWGRQETPGGMGTPEQPPAPDSSWDGVKTEGQQVAGGLIRQSAGSRYAGWGHHTPTDSALTLAQLTCSRQQEGEGEKKPHCRGAAGALLKSGKGRECTELRLDPAAPAQIPPDPNSSHLLLKKILSLPLLPTHPLPLFLPHSPSLKGLQAPDRPDRESPHSLFP